MIGTVSLMIILILLSAYFSATETAFSTLNEFRIKQLARSSKKIGRRAKITYKLKNEFSSLLSTTLVANNIVNMALSSIASYLCATKMNLGATGVLYATLITSVIVIILGEIIPKTLARIWPENFALFVTYPMRFLIVILKPITYWFTKFDEKVAEIADEDENRVTATEKELAEIVDTIEREGVLEHNESELIKNAMNFDEITINSIMLPKEKVVTINENNTFEEAVALFSKEKYSRIPVVNDQGNVVGLLLQNAVFNAYYENKKITIKELMNEPLFMSYRRSLPLALNAMQRDKNHLIIVVDNLKDKNYLGIITLEDVLEELVGEIYDEYDEIPPDVVEIGNNEFEVSGRVTIDELFDKYLPEVEDPKTKQLFVGPWVKELLGNQKWDSEIYYHNLRILVLEHDENRVIRISIEVISAFDEKL